MAPPSSAHLDQHGAEIVALAQGCAALVRCHLALAQLDHFLHHLIHARIGGRVQNGKAFDIEAALFGGRFDLPHIPDQNRGEEAVLLQAGGSGKNAGVSTLGIDDLAGVGFQNFNKVFKHTELLRNDKI